MESRATKDKLRSDLLLLLAALLWGFAFVAQRQGMQYIGAFLFNAIRFALGALAILPFSGTKFTAEELKAGISMGIILFIAASLQQFGIIYTTAGKAGFITGLYIVIVPMIGVFYGESSSLRTWAGVVAAVAGLYFLSFHGRIEIVLGDSLVLVSAFFFALHVRITGKYTQLHTPFKLAFLQFAVVAVLSSAGWIIYEDAQVANITPAIPAILYGGFISVGIAYTLQVFGQRKAPAADCAIILSLEGSFAVLGGYLLLSETMSLQSLGGCLLMLTGAVLAALPDKKNISAIHEKI